MRKKELLENLQSLHTKYADLVWYARSDADKHPEHKEAILKAQERIIENYPKEIDDYEETPEWTHGFNSGMLAAIRFIYTMDDENLERAIEEFPELYT
jgi:hypothetical protein